MLPAGIVGIGGIGATLAEMVAPFRMKEVIAFDPYIDEARAKEAGVRLTSLDELMAEADFISVNCPLNDVTRNLIGESQIARMKPTAFLINTARGSLLDEAAMVRALNEEWIAGAALDCFAKEPLAAEHPLRSAPNVLLCPHMAPFAWGNAAEMNRGSAQNVLDVLAGKHTNLVVNPEVFDSSALRVKSDA